MVQDNIPHAAAGYTLLSELDDLTWDSWLSLADVATAMNTKAASQGAIFANGFTNTYLTYSGIALVFNHTNLTAANAAAIFNEAGLTAANSALIFNEAGLTAANSALIFNEAGLTAANSALIFNEAGFSAANKALVFREAGLSIANINAIIIHANITDDIAQQILSEITKANRDLTSAANIYEILDDWNDNKLTSRDGAGTTSTGFTNLFAQKNLFRPEWTQTNADFAASGGILHLTRTSTASRLLASSTFVTGTWEIGFTRINTGMTATAIMIFGTDYQNGYYIRINHNTNTYKLCRMDAGGDESANLIISTWSDDANPHTAKVTRDGSGNFELFEDDVSKGTGGPDTTYTTSTVIGFIGLTFSGGNMDFDNLKVY